MKISEVVAELKKIQKKEGDINVCISESHEYWGSVETHFSKHKMTVSEHAQPDGPKSGKTEKALVFSY